MMNNRVATLLICIAGIFTHSGCSPLAAVGMVGSTITRSLEDPAVNQPRKNYLTEEEARRNIAIANVNLAAAYLQQGRFEKALEKLQRARMADPDYAPQYNVSGLVYQQLGDNQEAEQNFQKAIKLNPEDSSILNNYGLFLCQEKRFEEAELAFQKAAINPLYKTPEVAITNAGTCARENGQLELAEKHFRDALSLNPSITPALLQMAELQYQRGELNSAHDYLNRYLQIADHTPRTLWLGIRIEKELGDKDAVASYALLLRNRYADSREATLLKESDIR